MSKSAHNFTPLAFLAALGAGGISVIPFALFQYTLPHGPGLVTLAQLHHGSYPLGQEILYRALEGAMALFIVLHFALSLYFLPKFLAWRKTDAAREFMLQPTRNMAILAPFISLLMSMNVVLAGIRFFIPAVAANLQALMVPAFALWLGVWLGLIGTVLGLLHTAFAREFDVRRMDFGWLLYPFALAMLAVTGTGFAAVTTTPWLAHAAALLSMVPLTMAGFLFIVKMVAIFTAHFHADDLPARQFMPGFLSAVPIVTLMAISLFRLGHYLHRHLHLEVGAWYFWVIGAAYAFELWYLGFGLTMLRDYFRRDFFSKEYYLSQWALVCPFVAFAVLGAFLYSVFIPSPLFVAASVLSMAVAMGLFGMVLYRHFICKVQSKAVAQTPLAWQCS